MVPSIGSVRYWCNLLTTKEYRYRCALLTKHNVERFCPSTMPSGVRTGAGLDEAPASARVTGAHVGRHAGAFTWCSAALTLCCWQAGTERITALCVRLHECVMLP